MTVAVIDYGSGNLRSAAKSLERAAGTHKTINVTSDYKELAKASHIVLPGVGAFADCMQGLTSLPGMLDSLKEEVFTKRKPFLGICVGMQLLAEKGFEHGEHAGLGWIAGSVIPIKPQNDAIKIPHMGWNELQIIQDHPILKGIASGDHAYFVHSYHFACKNADDVLVKVEHGSPLTAVLAKDNIIATQFHPEKSQVTGLTLLNNFLMM